MLLWLAFSILTAAVAGTLMWSYRRAGDSVGGAGDADVAVYADQLQQIDSDRARGLLSEAEATSARAEVARRLLNRAAAEKITGTGGTGPRVSERLLNASILAIPILALGMYLRLGSPGLPDLPHAGRTQEEAARSQVDAMIARVEERLRSAPEDGNGWDVIAPVYLRMERYGQAAEAFANANRLLGESPKRLAGFAQAEILANNGVVNPNAKLAAERLLQLEPGRIDARMWVALAKEQDGQFVAALADYRSLLQSPQMTPPIASAIDMRIAAVEKLARGEKVEPPALAGGPVPGAGPAVGAEAGTPAAPADQQAMIESMVARLAARLGTDGKDPAGWSQLMRSYMVLGRQEAAQKALSDARTALAADPAGLEQVNSAAAALGLGEAAKDEKK